MSKVANNATLYLYLDNGNPVISTTKPLVVKDITVKFKNLTEKTISATYASSSQLKEWGSDLRNLDEQCITIEAASKESASVLWERLTQPEQVKTRNHASDDWYCPSATNDLRIGGEFHYEMAAKDGRCHLTSGEPTMP